MKILIIGGTLFVGRHYVDAALANNHEITIFHRGRLKTEPVEGVTHVLGDRETDLAKVADCDWDLVIDTCCYVPRVMRSTLAVLKDRIGMYLMVSTVSVYQMQGDFIIDEDSAKLDLIDENPDDKNEETRGYGENKLASERVLQQILPDKHLIIRPGVITGPYDVSGRLTYWLERFAFEQPAVTFGKPDAPVQWIDARDMCRWSLQLAEQGKGGVFNVTGPAQHCTAAQFYQHCFEVAGRSVEMIYLPANFTAELNQMHLPPGALGRSFAGFESFSQINCDKAIQQGLTFTAARQTFKQTFEWSALWQHDYHFKVSGMTSLHRPIEQVMEIEQQVLDQYNKYQGEQ